MKIALCLFGIVGKQGRLDIHPSVGYDYYKRNILQHNDVDVYIHSWSQKWESTIIDLYNPARYQFEKQIQFSEDEFAHRVASRWYSTKQSVHLVGEGYDMILLSRFDIAFLRPIDFSRYDPNYFHVGHYNVPGSKIDYTGVPQPKEIRTKYFYLGVNISQKRRGFIDQWFFSGPDIMRKFSMLYHYKDFYNIRPHIATEQHLRTITNNIRHTLYRGKDFEMIRKL